MINMTDLILPNRFKRKQELILPREKYCSLLRVNHLIGFGIGGKGIVDISKTDSWVDPNDLTNYTESVRAFGEAASNRYMLLCLAAQSSTSGRTINSITIGGVTATLVISVDGGSTGTSIAALYIALVPTGTTGDVVLQFSGGMTRLGFTLIRMTNVLDLAFDTKTDITVTGNALSNSLNISAGGVAIGVVQFAGNGGTRTCAWTSLATEDQDETMESASNKTISVAHDFFATEQSGLTITATASGSVDANGNALSLASFSPAN